MGSNWGLGDHSCPPTSYSFFLADGVGFEPTRTMSTRFPIVRLKPLGHPSKRGRTARTTCGSGAWCPSSSGFGIHGTSCRALAGHRGRCFANPPAAARVEPTRRVSSKRAWVRTWSARLPSLTIYPHLLAQKRREWDSNPRGASTNALAGRRLKPLGHPSQGTRRVFDALLSCPARART